MDIVFLLDNQETRDEHQWLFHNIFAIIMINIYFTFVVNHNFNNIHYYIKQCTQISSYVTSINILKFLELQYFL